MLWIPSDILDGRRLTEVDQGLRAALQGASFLLPAATPDGGHLAGMLVVVRQRAVDVRDVEVVAIRDGFGREVALLDPVGDLADADVVALDAGLAAHHGLVRHDAGGSLCHALV